MLLATDFRRSVLGELTPTGLNRVAYTPYGFQSAQRRVGSSLGFNGERPEALTGCYHLGNGHRIYNPILMRFYSPDRLSPFGKGGLNPYAYCVGDPVNFTDPTGKWPEWLQPVLTIGLHVGIIAATFLTSAISPPVGLSLMAARTSLIASPIAILGSGLQLAGVKEGKVVSAVGTALSTAAVFTRAGLALKNLLSKPDPLGEVTKSIRHLIGLKPKLPQATRGTSMPTLVPSPAGLPSASIREPSAPAATVRNL